MGISIRPRVLLLAGKCIAILISDTEYYLFWLMEPLVLDVANTRPGPCAGDMGNGGIFGVCLECPCTGGGGFIRRLIGTPAGNYCEDYEEEDQWNFHTGNTGAGKEIKMHREISSRGFLLSGYRVHARCPLSHCQKIGVEEERCSRSQMSFKGLSQTNRTVVGNVNASITSEIAGIAGCRRELPFSQCTQKEREKVAGTFPGLKWGPFSPPLCRISHPRSTRCRPRPSYK